MLPNRHHRHNWPRIVVRTEAPCVVGWGTSPLWPSVSSTIQGISPRTRTLLLFGQELVRWGPSKALLQGQSQCCPKGRGLAFSQHDSPPAQEEHWDPFSFSSCFILWAPQFSLLHHLPLAVTCPMNKCWVLGKEEWLSKPPWSASQTASQEMDSLKNHFPEKRKKEYLLGLMPRCQWTSTFSPVGRGMWVFENPPAV